MHLVWVSDSPTTPSGFGNVTRFVCEGLARRGHRVSIIGWQTREPTEWNGCQVYPIGRDPFGSDALFRFLIRHRPQAVIALADIWWLPYFAAPHVRRQMELIDAPWLLYFPVDGETQDGRLPPSWIDLLKEVDVPIAMSRYGQRIAQACGVRSEYIPHGVDLDIFSPPASRHEAKALVGASGRFVVLSDCRNQPRKLLPRVLDTFSRFSAGRPDALLHLHTDPDDEYARSGYYSYDVRSDVRHLGLESQVRFSPGFAVKPGGGLPLSQLAAYYQAADVHLLASSGEGFGLPTLQAAAAGAVPMACAYSASRELVEGHGAAIPVEAWTDNEFGIRRALIDRADAAATLAAFYEDRELLRRCSARSREFATAYGWDLVLDMWDQLLTSIGGRNRRIFGFSRRVEPAQQVTKQLTSPFPGVSITVNMMAREAGRLEAAIGADMRRNSGDIRLPAVQPHCELGNLRVPRRQSYLGVAPTDQGVFAALQRVFPDLGGWVPVTAGGAPLDLVDGLTPLPVADVDDARYELARSVLVLNLGGGLPEAMLIDAALFGVVGIGSAVAPAQTLLWPELVVDTEGAAITVARELLTDAAKLARISGAGRDRARLRYGSNPEAAAASLRRLHAANQQVA